MANSLNCIIDICGYEFFQITFVVVVCLLPYIFVSYSVCFITLCLVTKGLLTLWDNYVRGYIDVKGRGVFITGCDAGLGHDYARHLDSMGFVVFAGCLDENGQGTRKLKHSCSRRLHIVEIDITKDKSVARAFDFVRKNAPRNGRIVNITSIHAFIGIENWSMYEVSKHCLETVSDSLRLEMKKFGIDVSIVEPSMFGRQTSIHNEAMYKRHKANLEEMWNSASEETRKAYPKQQIESWISAPVISASDVQSTSAVSKAVEHALCSVSPRSRYMVSGYGSKITLLDEYYMLGKVFKQLPTCVTDKYIRIWRKLSASDR